MRQCALGEKGHWLGSLETCVLCPALMWHVTKGKSLPLCLPQFPHCKIEMSVVNTPQLKKPALGRGAQPARVLLGRKEAQIHVGLRNGLWVQVGLSLRQWQLERKVFSPALGEEVWVRTRVSSTGDLSRVYQSLKALHCFLGSTKRAHELLAKGRVLIWVC